MDPAPSPPAAPPPAAPQYAVVGRYAIFDEIASGGMAAVHLGRLLGPVGFSRTVAIKRLHPQFARDAEFSAMFLDEARLAARISHPNVVQTIDVVPIDKEILLVMEYVHGAPFAHLLGVSRRAGYPVPPRIIAGVMVGALEGLHAAHEAKNEKGAPLGVVHRDVSPQNILVGVEGVPRVIDFGVAKAMGKMHATRDGQLKGKLAYMSPEQVRSAEVTRVSDVFSASIVLWEALTSERLFDGSNPAEIIMQVLGNEIVPPRKKVPDLPAALDEVVMRGLSREPRERFATAREMAAAIEAAIQIAPAREIADWVEGTAGVALSARAKLIEQIEHVAPAAPTSGERTRIEGLKAQVGGGAGADLGLGAGAGAGEELGSGPRPVGRGEPASARGEGMGLDATMPQKTRSVAPGPAGAPGGAPGVREEPPADALLSSGSAGALGALGAPPAKKALDPVSDSLSARPAVGSGARVHRIPVRVDTDDEDKSSLAARLGWPIRLVVAGVFVSLVDFVVRQVEIPIPVRLVWLSGVLVVAGVIWAFVLVALPQREE